MKRLVSALDAGQTLALEHDLLRRADLHVHTVTTIEELLVAAREGAQVCLVGPLLPDGDARDALEAVRADRDLTDMPVVLVATPEIAGRVGSDGFTAVLHLPYGGALDEKLSRLLAAPKREARRRQGFARVRDAEQQPVGHAVDFSDNGILLRTRRAFALGQDVTLSLELPGASAPILGHARVVRIANERVALAFQEATPALRAAIADAMGAPSRLPGSPEIGLSFQPRAELGARGAELAGALIEGPALAALSSHLLAAPSEPARLVVRDLAPFDDAMLDRFLALVSGATGSIELRSCPVWLSELCARLPALSARVTIASMWVVVRCQDCDQPFQDLAELGAGSRSAAETALAAITQPPCLVCGSALQLVGNAAALLAFLS